MAIIINFTIIGLWHGANWTYVLFGFIHGCYFIPLIIKDAVNKKKVIAKGKLLPSLKEIVNVIVNCFFVMLTFVLFRSSSITVAIKYYAILFSKSLASKPIIAARRVALMSFVFLIIMFVIEWINRDKEFGLQIDNIKRPLFRQAIYFALILSIIFASATEANQFIYFKF